MRFLKIWFSILGVLIGIVSIITIFMVIGVYITEELYPFVNSIFAEPQYLYLAVLGFLLSTIMAIVIWLDWI